jgi:hypothetical protein
MQALLWGIIKWGKNALNSITTHAAIGDSSSESNQKGQTPEYKSNSGVEIEILD